MFIYGETIRFWTTLVIITWVVAGEGARDKGKAFAGKEPEKRGKAYKQSDVEKPSRVCLRL
jgi:hypothetical protein